MKQKKLCLYSVSHTFSRLMRRYTVKLNAKRLMWLTVQSAVHHLNDFRVSLSRDYGSDLLMVTSDYQSMYAYKCGFYEQCLRFCERNVEYILSARVAQPARVFSSVYSDVMLLLDDDCMSFIGLATLCFFQVNINKV